MGKVTFCYGLILGTIALAADTGYLNDLLNHAHLIPYGDKAIHFTLVALVATMEECSNAWTPYRTCSLGDLAANYLGVVAVGVLPLLIYCGWLERGAHPPHLADAC